MADEVSPEIIQSTQKLLGKHVSKPQLSEKLLKKPPFRFLHDIINALVRDNGFLKGYFTESELNSDNVKDREAKIAFLNKLINAIKSLSGKDLKVRANKIVAGLDATETNRLLQTIGRLLDDKIDTRGFVKEFKKSGKTGKEQTENAKKTESKTSVKASDKDSSRKKEKAIADKDKTKKKPESTPRTNQGTKSKVDSTRRPSQSDKGSKLSSRGSVSSKESKTKSKTDSEKTTASKASPRISNSTSSTPKSEMKAEINEGAKEETKESPKEEPMEVMKEEIPNEQPEDSPREPDSWRPQIMDQEIPSMAAPIEETKEIKNAKTEEEQIRQPSARPKSARPRSGSGDAPRPSSHMQQKQDKKPEAEVPRPPSHIQQRVENKVPEVNDAPRPPSHMQQRPQSKKPEPMRPVMPIQDFSLKNTENVMEQPQSKDNEPAKKTQPFRPKSSLLRPPSVRPSSARPGAPRLRPDSALPMKEIVPLGKINVIVENYDATNGSKDEDEEETVVIENVAEDVPEPQFIDKGLDIPADKGHLVEQILEQMQGPDAVIDDVKGQLEWENENIKGKDATTKEINALRASIQSLTRTANPLGKLTSYLHEDVEAMHSELQTWLNMKKQFSEEIAKQKRINNESNQPLLKQLNNLEENIKKEMEEIAAVKYNIMKNEERIRQLVTKQILIE